MQMWLRKRPRTASAASLLALATLLATYGGLPASAYADCCPTYAPPRPAAVAHNDGPFTLLDGHQAHISRYFGRPVMAWFVSDRCASCVLSIKTVAAQLPKFEKSGVGVLVLGIYGQFGNGPEARAELTAFGRGAAGAAFSSRLWVWGLASEPLSARYDPKSIPDDYFLLARGGRRIYHNIAPVSTMAALLHHIAEPPILDSEAQPVHYLSDRRH